MLSLLQLSTLGGICSSTLFSCDTSDQNNWIFSQLIHTLAAKEIFFNVTLLDCYIGSCTDRITLHINNTEVDSSSRTDPTKYGSLVHTKDPTNALMSSTQSENNGLYFGIQDRGFCGSLGRIIIYYKVCPGRRSGLVTYPERALPPTNGPLEYFDASCVENAHNTTSLQVKVDGTNGMCTDVVPGEAKCECNLGYSELNGACACKSNLISTLHF